MRLSAGTLLYRGHAGAWEVLLVHPSGAYNRKAPWSIPKGLPDPGETEEEAARRETLEETGVRAGELALVGRVRYTKTRKEVVGFAGRAPADAAPRCASWEIDRAEFLPLARAREVIHRDQAALLDALEALLAGERAPAT